MTEDATPPAKPHLNIERTKRFALFIIVKSRSESSQMTFNPIMVIVRQLEQITSLGYQTLLFAFNPNCRQVDYTTHPSSTVTHVNLSSRRPYD